MLFNVFSYFTKTHIVEYRVQQGTIVTDNIYKGIALRDETIEYANQNGYVDYYIANASKVSVTDVIYSIDTIGNISGAIAEDSTSLDALSQESIQAITMHIDDFLKKYDANQFRNNYSFLYGLNSEITHTINENILSNLSDKIAQAENNNTFFKFTSQEDGIIVYEVDGYESYTADSLMEDFPKESTYQKTLLTTNRQVKPTDPVYKRINTEHWEIILQIDEKTAKELHEKSTISIRFCKDDFSTNAACSVLKKNNTYFLKLSLQTAMIRYIDERFLDIELVMKDTSGLKIPKTSITTKEFFTVPKEFFTEGQNGLLIQSIVDGKKEISLVNPTIYQETDTHYYIDSEYVKAGNIVVMPDSSSNYVIGTHTDSLVGVYNINKGYAVFKRIQILFENEDYAIVDSKTSYGIALYDHIALDAGAVKEHQLTSN